MAVRSGAKVAGFKLRPAQPVGPGRRRSASPRRDTAWYRNRISRWAPRARRPRSGNVPTAAFSSSRARPARPEGPGRGRSTSPPVTDGVGSICSWGWIPGATRPRSGRGTTPAPAPTSSSKRRRIRLEVAGPAPPTFPAGRRASADRRSPSTRRAGQPRSGQSPPRAVQSSNLPPPSRGRGHAAIPMPVGWRESPWDCGLVATASMAIRTLDAVRAQPQRRQPGTCHPGELRSPPGATCRSRPAPTARLRASFPLPRVLHANRKTKYPCRGVEPFRRANGTIDPDGLNGAIPNFNGKFLR
jgi:hypothetical protein